MYVDRPFAVRQADTIAGRVTIAPNPSYQRLIPLVLRSLLRPGKGAEYYNQPVCLSVCLSVRKHISGTAGPIFMKFGSLFCCGRGSASSGGAAIRYILPVLWTASRLAVVDRMAMRGKRRCDIGA